MSWPPGYTLRPATVHDAALIQTQRTAMFTEMGSDPAGLARAHDAGVGWHRRALASGRYTGLLVEAGGDVVAGAGVLWNDFPPNADTTSLVRAYVLNVYVHPDHRGHALARQLVEAVLAECRARGVSIVTLTASEAGRPTYERLGFVPQAELRLVLPEGAS
ncbi:GNAT superfamily N-acetyltransferase [Deinococcus metalli]|uniref:GNAT superfamily N-acetyltransferase n=1 Tax=Deinococcus metalli TaxID=1141878 RepID=A0A7W8NTM5_9DEIO|nr:GNAT family N-acetyltransferase [Deinococcus metalli]MBB5378337.1 GNAT superfamily N-acetyltransferase [Deinococcus metalli]